jgi:3D (Asp-Asp-Asp) domain-containing protein
MIAEEKGASRFLRPVMAILFVGVFVFGFLFEGSRDHVESDSRNLIPVESLQQASNELTKATYELNKAMEILEECFGGAVDLERVRSVPVTLTAYSSTEDQCNEEPHITASNRPVRIGIIAVSFDIMEELGLTFGQRVLIPGHGLFQVQDRMNRRWHRRVDIWHNDREAAMLFGRQQGTMLWIEGREAAEIELLAGNDAGY